VSEIDLEIINDKELVQEVEKHLIDEWKNLIDFFHYFTKKNKCLGNFFNSNINKLICLDIAKECGLETPDTLIISDIQKVQKFKDTHNQIITKGIQESASFTTKLYYLQNYTEEIFEYESSKFVEFFPTLFQQKLEKDYELRIFYFYGEFYSMAIFSQLDTQTQIDFRKYNDIKPNRTVPYTLPINIANNLRQFMNKIDLNTGSIDMVVTKGKRYVFLEVNPVGQFGMVSNPCNYYLEKKITECLSSK
jgi:ATP-GRASP peptide maturase of grasp-with-spasm system